MNLSETTLEMFPGAEKLGAKVILGTGGIDQIVGTITDDIIKGLVGTDFLNGWRGNDIIYGGADNDSISDTFGANTLYGGSGNDYLYMGSSPSQAFGGTGDDYLRGGTSRSVLNGGSGNDYFLLGTGGTAIGAAGDDIFEVNYRNKVIDGGTGKDTVTFNVNFKYFEIVYKENGILLRDGDYHRMSGIAPNLTTFVDDTIEKIVWKNFSIDRMDFATPTITSIGDTREDKPHAIYEGRSTVYGRSDPFATITIVFGDTVLGQTIADRKGSWYFAGNFKIESGGSYALTAIADFGLENFRKASESYHVEFVKPLVAEKLSTTEGATIIGAPEDTFGSNAVVLGDINGDGLDDIAISAERGKTFVLYGRSDWAGHMPDLKSLTASDGFVLDGFSTVTGPAGDLNGDGIDDFAIGAFSNGFFGYAIIYGAKSGPTLVDVANRPVITFQDLDESLGVVVQSTSVWGLSFDALNSIGDVNGDGVDDIVIGANSSSMPNGGAYVLYGGTELAKYIYQGRANLDIEDLNPDQGFLVRGDPATGRAGPHVKSAGDINGDGLGDFIVGAERSGSRGYIGSEYVIFGKQGGLGETIGGQSILALQNLRPEDGFVVEHETIGGHSTTGIGDFNADGYDDLIVSVPWADRHPAGVFLIFGHAGSYISTVDPYQLEPDRAVLLTDTMSNRRSLGDVATTAGDFNGDGYGDFVVSGGGDVRVIFGTADEFGEVVDGVRTLEIDRLKHENGLLIRVDLDKYGSVRGPQVNISSAGDLNGDGFDDLVLALEADSGSSNKRGVVYIIYGNEGGSATGSVAQTGTPAAEVLIGGASDDTLDGKGGEDIFRGGGGNDVIRIGDANFRQIRAGRGGLDTVEFNGSGVVLDARNFSNSQMCGIEQFNLTGTGSNGLLISAADIFHFSSRGNSDFTSAESINNLVVKGNSDDLLQLLDYAAKNAEWELDHENVYLNGVAGGDFDTYNLTDGNRTFASIAVSADMTVL
ncbi:FG-GAP repeat protein [Rhizobium sp. KVB221]|uniref:FG-GAP repeat protein n=1 Tax=Rhizobium setariae TaxID=2801340 RepID=A0A936YRP2_9HYPH|nr:FG-GAP repeat protein [Rhizobium setariae]MBL0374418.1 FG-GAP repeat protein [Rhizobium setariae]